MESVPCNVLITETNKKINTMKTIQKLFILLGLLATVPSYAQAYGEIRGIIKNTELEAIPYATVKILQGNLLVAGSQTDEKGRYSVKPLGPGSYEMVIQHIEYQTQQINKIKVNPNEATYVDYKMSVATLEVIDVTAKAIDYTRSGVDQDMFHTKSLSAEELLANASIDRGDIQGAIEASTSDAFRSSDGELHVRGSRGDATGFFIDGVRVLNASTIPGHCIENLSIFTGGVPAMYGDLTSGAVMITTKTYFSGIRDKNVRIAVQEERRREAAARERAEEEEKNRAKEIEEEKKQEAEGKK